LRPQHVHPVAIPAHRQNGHDEHQNTHAAHPVGEAAPEQNAPVQRLHLRQDGGPRGGEAGDCLKEAIYKALYGAGDVKGQRTEEGHGNPRQRHYRQAVPCEQRRLPRLFEAQQSSAQHQQRRREQIRDRGFPISQSHRHGKQQQRRLHQQDTANGKADHSIIHRTYLPSHSARISRRSSSWVSVVTTITSSWRCRTSLPEGMTICPFCRTIPASSRPRFRFRSRRGTPAKEMSGVTLNSRASTFS
ncbi:DUF4241 domain-containing protein, partial [Dysosmobacter welbionis]